MGQSERHGKPARGSQEAVGPSIQVRTARGLNITPNTHPEPDRNEPGGNRPSAHPFGRPNGRWPPPALVKMLFFVASLAAVHSEVNRSAVIEDMRKLMEK